jgi:hypothetical protein
MAVITTARTLPVMELRPGLKDVRRPAALMYADIVLSLLCGLRTEDVHALRWPHRRELRPVITTGAKIMDRLFTAT